MVDDEVVLRVVTANAASGRDRRGRVDHARWAGAVAEAQHGLDADVWAVQEVDHRLPRSGGVDQTAELGAALRGGTTTPWSSTFAAAVLGEPGSLDGIRPARESDPAAPSYGVALHCRLPVRATHERHLAPSRLRIPVLLPSGAGRRVLWVPDEPRVALAAEVVAPTGPVTVVTTHLSFAPWQARAQLRTLLAWAAALPRPLVLLGDLNLAGTAPGRVSGLPGSGSAPTYPSHRPRRRLDHVLLDHGGAAYALRDRGTPQVGASDHLAVAAELRRGRAGDSGRPGAVGGPG